MRNSPLGRNRVFVLFSSSFHIVSTTVLSTVALLRSSVGKKSPPIGKNRLLETLHFLFVTGPRHFWKKPTAIAAGRSLGTLFHFFLEKDLVFKEKTNSKKGFTIVELLVSITMFSVLMLAAFEAFGQIGFYRGKITNQIDLGQDLYYNVEKLSNIIKEGGGIDYEEYFNRYAVGTGTNAGAYNVPTGFGNYGKNGVVGTATWGDAAYSCLSATATLMGTGGCLENAFNTTTASQKTFPQRYGQYAKMFKDLNSNANGDLGDEDGVGGNSGDDDDEDLGQWPVAMPFGSGITELYLWKNGLIPERLALRWRVELDPEAPATATCDLTTATGPWCIGRLEMLRLVGYDLGINHSAVGVSPGRYDGEIDTWQCRNDFNCLGTANTPSGWSAEWASVFPNDIDVKSIRFFPAPEKNSLLSWHESAPSIRVAPYVRVEMSLGLSWARKKRSTLSDVRTNVATTISLNP